MGVTTPAASAVTYMSSVSMQDEGPFSSFKEALENFMDRMKKMIGEGTSMQVVETACWIERRGNGARAPLMFYSAKDFGYKVGLLQGTDCSFVAEAQEPDPVLVADLFAMSAQFGGNPFEFIDRLPKIAA